MHLKKQPISYRLLFLFLGLLVIAIGLRIYIFHTSLTYLPISADETLSTLQGKQISEGNRPLFVMANPYQFPAEAYLMAPLHKLLPQNRFGARILIVICSFLSLLALIYAFLKIANLKDIWPGLLLLMSPSIYLLTLQFAHNVPYHGFSIFIWSLCFLSMILSKTTQTKKYIYLVFTAVLCGFSFSIHMLSLSLIFMFALFSCSDNNFKKTLKNTLLFSPGFLLGLFPYLYGQLKFPQANQGVTNLRSLLKALKLLWPLGFKHTLPGTMGIKPPLYPDIKLRYEYLPYIETIFTYLFAFILLTATIVSLVSFCLRLKKNKWPTLTVNDIFVGAIWSSLLLFILNERSSSSSFRYLLPIPFCFPFLLGSLYQISKKPFRYVIALTSIFIALYSTVMSFYLMEEWKQTDFRALPKFSEIDPVIKRLKEKNIFYCYAGYRDVYRINYLSDNEIICSQPLNERFPGWSIPYKHIVDQQPTVAYVLTSTGRTLTPNKFETHLSAMNVSFQKESVGDFVIYDNFKDNYALYEKEINGELLSFSSSHNAKDANNLNPSSPISYPWSSQTNQQEGMSITIELAKKKNINRISFIYKTEPKRKIPYISIEAKSTSGWKTVVANKNNAFDKFLFVNNHPSYSLKGNAVQTYHFQPIYTNLLRIRVQKPVKNEHWVIYKIKLYEKI